MNTSLVQNEEPELEADVSTSKNKGITKKSELTQVNAEKSDLDMFGSVYIPLSRDKFKKDEQKKIRLNRVQDLKKYFAEACKFTRLNNRAKSQSSSLSNKESLCKLPGNYSNSNSEKTPGFILDNGRQSEIQPQLTQPEAGSTTHEEIQPQLTQPVVTLTTNENSDLETKEWPKNRDTAQNVGVVLYENEDLDNVRDGSLDDSRTSSCSNLLVIDEGSNDEMLEIESNSETEKMDGLTSNNSGQIDEQSQLIKAVVSLTTNESSGLEINEFIKNKDISQNLEVIPSEKGDPEAANDNVSNRSSISSLLIVDEDSEVDRNRESEKYNEKDNDHNIWGEIQSQSTQTIASPSPERNSEGPYLQDFAKYKEINKTQVLEVSSDSISSNSISSSDLESSDDDKYNADLDDFDSPIVEKTFFGEENNRSEEKARSWYSDAPAKNSNDAIICTLGKNPIFGREFGTKNFITRRYSAKNQLRNLENCKKIQEEEVVRLNGSFDLESNSLQKDIVCRKRKNNFEQDYEVKRIRRCDDTSEVKEKISFEQIPIPVEQPEKLNSEESSEKNKGKINQL